MKTNHKNQGKNENQTKPNQNKTNKNQPNQTISTQPNQTKTNHETKTYISYVLKGQSKTKEMGMRYLLRRTFIHVANSEVNCRQV